VHTSIRERERKGAQRRREQEGETEREMGRGRQKDRVERRDAKAIDFFLTGSMFDLVRVSSRPATKPYVLISMQDHATDKSP
jgi:hypothetical protein